MKIPRFLTVLCSIFLVIVFVRAVNGAGEFSLHDILVRLEQFDFSFDSLEELLSVFAKGSFSSHLEPWDSSLTGVDGFFENFSNVVGSFFTACASVISGFFVAIWHLVLDVLGIFVSVFNLFTSVLGFDVYIDWHPVGGYRGGR